MTIERQRAGGDRVHDLSAQKRSELLEELFRFRCPGAHLVGKSTVSGTLTKSDFRSHVDGRQRFGVLPFMNATDVWWGAIDLDFASPAWGELDPASPEAIQKLNAMVESLALRGLRGIVERSRSKGWHLWVFLDAAVRAADLRAFLSEIALGAGAPDTSDLVCPRQDRVAATVTVDSRGKETAAWGNGTYLPLFGGDAAPHTRFHECDADRLEWREASAAAVMRSAIDFRNPASAIPKATSTSSAAGSAAGDVPDEHACGWILDELEDEGIDLHGLLATGSDTHPRLEFACPLHVAAKVRARGGSGVFFSDGGGRCNSARCGRRWKSPAEFVALLRGLDDEPTGPDAPGTPEAAPEIPGLDLNAIRARPRGTSPLPGLLPEDPALTVLVSRPKVGKTRLGLSIGQAASARVAPWPGAPDLDMKVAVVEAEEPAADTLRALDALELMALPRRPREAWEARLSLIARDPLLDEQAAQLLRLDAAGLASLRHLARSCDLVILDSLSRLKPSTVEEINNDHMSVFLDELQRIAAEEHCYLLLLHHEGHADRDDPVSAGRGASAISAVARCIWRLDRVNGEPRRRRLRVRGNAVPDAELTFEIASEDAQPEGVLLYWRPVDPLGGVVALEDVLPEVGAECTTSDLARALSDCRPDEKPSGRAARQAAALRERWRRGGEIEVLEGPHRAVLLRRIR